MSPGGTSKRTGQSMRKEVVEALEAPVDIIQSIAEAGKEVENIIKYLL